MGNIQSLISKSSYSLLYLRTFFLIAEPLTQVIWSSMFLLTWKAGSVTVSTPTLTWPYSINITASFTVSAIFNLYITTGSLLLQKPATVTFSHDTSPYLELANPISNILVTKASLYTILYQSLDFKTFSLAIILAIYPHNLLYLV